MANHMKRELSEQHNRIVTECNKICNYLCLIYNKSENILCKSFNMRDDEMLPHYAKVYEYLSSLYLQLINISCKLQLFVKEFDDKEKDIPKELIYKDTIDISNNLPLTQFMNAKQSIDVPQRNVENYDVIPILDKKSKECLKPIPIDDLRKTNIQRIKTSPVTEQTSSIDNICRYEDIQSLSLLNKQTISNITSNSMELNNVPDDYFSFNGIPNMDNFNTNNLTNNQQIKVEDIKTVTDTLLNMIPVMNSNFSPNHSFSSSNLDGLNSLFNNTRTTDIDISDFEMKLDDNINGTIKNDDLILFSSKSNSTISNGSKTASNKINENKVDENEEILEENEIKKNNTFEESVLEEEEHISSKSKDVSNCFESIPSGSKDEPINLLNQSIKSLRSSKRSQTSNSNRVIRANRPAVLKSIMEKSKIPTLSDPIEGEICIVGHVESPSLFYIHLVREETSRLDILQFDIEETIDNLTYYTKKRDAMSSIKSECVCYDEKHEQWCRAYIIDWNVDNEDFVTCYLMDYGEIIDVALTNIRQMVEILYCLPHFAIPCKLAFLVPADGSNKWSEEVTDYFLNHLELDNFKECMISFVERDGDILNIDLTGKKTESIANNMILNGLAVSTFEELQELVENIKSNSKDDNKDPDEKDLLCNFMKEQIKFSHGFSSEEYVDEDAMLASMCSSEEQELNMYDNPILAVSHYEAKDERRVCHFLKARGGCWKGTECRYSHEPLLADGWTTDRQVIYHSAFNELILPNAGVTANVLVASIKDLTTFYVRIKSYPDMFKPKYQPVNSLHGLISMMNRSEEIRMMPPLNVMPADGEIVLVKYDNQWQRGRVLDQIFDRCDSILFEVLLVDFGLIITSTMKDFRAISDKFLILPFQAVLCYLVNVRRKGNLTEEQYHYGRDFLEAITLDKTLPAKIFYSGNHIKVLLSDEEGNDIGEQLIELGIVNTCTEYLTNEKVGRCVLVE